MKTKFRGWDTRLNKMYYPEELEKQNRCLGSNGIIVAMDLDSNNETLWMCDWVKPLFFTGLQDKRGKDIYEGDIVKFTNCRFFGDEGVFDGEGEIEYRAGGFSVRSLFNNHGVEFSPCLYNLVPWTRSCEEKLEVINNIFEDKRVLG